MCGVRTIPTEPNTTNIRACFEENVLRFGGRWRIMLPMQAAQTTATSAITRVAQQFELPIEQAQIEACGSLAEWVAPAAAKLGLTRFADAGDLADNLMGPAICLTAHIGAECRSVADIGAGSGALGLAIGLLRPDLSVSLLDRGERVCHFIDLAAKRFGLANCNTVCADMRTGVSVGGKYDMVAARALDSGDELVGELAALAAKGGRIAVFGTSSRKCLPPGLVQEIHQETNVVGLWLDIYRVPQHQADGDCPQVR